MWEGMRTPGRASVRDTQRRSLHCGPSPTHVVSRVLVSLPPSFLCVGRRTSLHGDPRQLCLRLPARLPPCPRVAHGGVVPITSGFAGPSSACPGFLLSSPLLRLHLRVGLHALRATAGTPNPKAALSFESNTDLSHCKRHAWALEPLPKLSNLSTKKSCISYTFLRFRPGQWF